MYNSLYFRHPVYSKKKEVKVLKPSWIHPVTAIVILFVSLLAPLVVYLVNYFQTVGFDEKPTRSKKLSKKKVSQWNFAWEILTQTTWWIFWNWFMFCCRKRNWEQRGNCRYCAFVVYHWYWRWLEYHVNFYRLLLFVVVVIVQKSDVLWLLQAFISLIISRNDNKCPSNNLIDTFDIPPCCLWFCTNSVDILYPFRIETDSLTFRHQISESDFERALPHYWLSDLFGHK